MGYTPCARGCSPMAKAVPGGWEVRYYAVPGENPPFRTWFRSLADRSGRVKIEARITRLRQSGHCGRCKPVGEGVMELVIDSGPGYRIYYAKEGTSIVLLLCGGDKSTQRVDIECAKSYWKEHKQRLGRGSASGVKSGNKNIY